MIIKLLDSAEDDLVEGYHFYERKAEGLGNYFLDSLFSDIASLHIYAGIHSHQLYVLGKSRHLPQNLIKRAIRRLEYIDLAKSINDLRVPASNRLHSLKGNREGQFSISINDQCRICFRFIENDAYDVEIIDYH